MSAICQTFVKNTWRKDLCSNCFKSEEEHGGNNCGIAVTAKSSIPSGDDGRNNEVSKGLGRGGSGRYMGVGGSVFQRDYYKRNSWKSLMIDNTDSGLKSPGLIKGMSNFINNENEKNIALSNTVNPPNLNNNNNRSSGLYQHVKTSQSEAKLLSDFLDDNHEKENDKGDVSSDLGSDVSHDLSGSSVSSHNSIIPTSDVASGGTSSDTASMKSDQDSEHFEEYSPRIDLEKKRRDIEKEIAEVCKQIELTDLKNVSQISKLEKTMGILRESRLGKTHQKNIFWKSDDQVIGYGGDVDYSDDEDYSDDDDDFDEDDETDLLPDERVLKRLTERNTIFNEEKENLLKDRSDLKTVPSTRYEAPNKTYIVDSDYEIEETGTDENRNSQNFESLTQEEKKEEKSEPKIKLKRSAPLSASVKPLISRNLNDVKVNQVLPMKNGEVIRPKSAGENEPVPLAGIKPKYVSIEDEMVEKIDHNELISRQKDKLTSIDAVISEPNKKVTSIDDIIPKNDTYKNIQKTTSIDDIIPIQNSIHETVQKDSFISEKSIVNEITRYDKEKIENISSNVNGNPHIIKENVPQKELREITPDIQMAPSKAPVVPKPRLSKMNKVNNLPERRNTTTNMIMKFIQDDYKTNNTLKRNSLDSNNLSVIQPNITEIGVKNNIITKNTSPQPLEYLKTEIPNLESFEINKKTEEVVAPKQGSTDDLGKKSENSSPETRKTNNIENKITTLEDTVSQRSISSQESYENPKTPASISSQESYENPKTPASISSQESYENPKTPASRQNSTSSFTTFGTPVVIATSTPQSSFLHQNSRGSMYDDIYGTTKSPIYTPAKDFLKEIKSQPEVSTPTAGISKGSLYASTSCLKGLPSKKPVLTPKPPILKEKPKILYKTPVNASRIYATPSPIVPKVAIGNLSSAVSSPSLLTATALDDKDYGNSSPRISSSTYNSHSDSRLNLQDSSSREYAKPPPTTQAPAIPTTPTHSRVEAVYDVPVRLITSTPLIIEPAVTPKIVDSNNDEEVIYQEVDETMKARLRMSRETAKMEENAYHVSNVSPVPTVPTTSPPKLSPIVSSVARQESTRCQSRSTFEANRSLLSAALSFGSNSVQSDASKRSAPQPPKEDIYQNQSDVNKSSEELSTQKNSSDTNIRKENNIILTQGNSSELLTQRNSSDTNIRKENNFISIPDNRDGESYSSFTDDFDDDDYEDDEDDQPTLKAAERSSSANPFFRNSIGPIHTYNPTASSGATYGTSNAYVIPTGAPLSESSGKAAIRSHSVPRVSEHIIKKDIMLIPPVSASSTSTSSKFSFGKSGFFQPSSSSNAKSDKQERGRDRSKKSSRFSLKKLLRIGSKDDEKKDSKSEAKQAEREAKKNKLQIIHPLDYNQNGVEVIARPEKTSPLYDYTGIYGYIPPPQQTKEEIYAAISTVTQLTSASPVPSSLSYASEDTYQELPLRRPDGSSVYSTAVSNDNIYAVSAPSSISTTQPPSLSSQPVSSFSSMNPSSSSVPSGSSISTATISASIPIVSDSHSQPQKQLEKRNSFLKKDESSSRCIDRRESITSHNSNVGPTQSQIHLGYNSEGRPKPPPPPRKVSLEGGLGEEAPLYDVSSASRPLRPPPPTRTPSNAGTKSGPPRPDQAKLTRDSVYANIGDVRAPFTPRKPGRSASIRGDDDREKRRAPQPPSSSSSTRSSTSSLRGSAKGPAPSRPQSHQPTSEATATEYALNVDDSTSSSRQEKTSRVSVRRSSAVTHRSLEDHYGAVVSANHEALSNMFDQISSYVCPSGMDGLMHHMLRWSDVRLNSDTAIVEAGYRMFYHGSAVGYNVTLMVTPESNVEAHHLLTPLPIISFKDELPSHLLSKNNISRRDTISATVWVLPSMDLATLQEISEEQQEQLTHNPGEWERKTYLLLLQLVTGLKQLQAQGVEETSIDFALVSRGQDAEGQDPDNRLILIPPVDAGGCEFVSLCQMASLATLLLVGVEAPLKQVLGGAVNLPCGVPAKKPFTILLKLLHQEKAGSLTQVKCLLELLLYGPNESSVTDATSVEEVESMMQRWLDLERANVLQSLITSPPAAKIDIKYQLLFLVRSNARTLRDSIKLLDDTDKRIVNL